MSEDKLARIPSLIRHILAALRYPRIASNFALAVVRKDYDARERIYETYTIMRALGPLFPKQNRKLRQFADEILNSQFHRSITGSVSSDRCALSSYLGVPIWGAGLIYVICRFLRPRRVVETGVGPGVSTAYILKALEDNDFGRLWSVDMPYRQQELRKFARDTRRGFPEFPAPESIRSGWLVPQSLKSRWTLRVGKTRHVLPEILEDLQKIDIFLHDSEHTYENMLFEYRCVWPYLPRGGMLLSHDIECNNAFQDFAREVDHKPFSLFWFGAILKSR